MASFEIHHGDALDVLRGMADNSIDAIVTDPPAGIAFMGKEWDKDKGGRSAWIAWMSQIAAECLRVLKPGAHALVWAIPRTSHWTATAWEDAGFEVRDRIAHVFGSGFPKSLDVSKAIDKMYGAEREVVGNYGRSFRPHSENTTEGWDRLSHDIHGDITAPATEAAKQWEGWGTALKPAVEDWWLLRKPISESSIAANVLRWGTGGVNVDGCRIEAQDGVPRFIKRAELSRNAFANGINGSNRTGEIDRTTGRFPANLVHDGSAEVVAMFPVVNSGGVTHQPKRSGFAGFNRERDSGTHVQRLPDTGSAARFFKACPPDDAASLFYCAKASRSERDAGLDGMPLRNNMRVNAPRESEGEKTAERSRNHHPTVKPQSLMRYLCRLITPPNGIILDPFFGSGSTGVAAITEGFSIIGIEQDAEFAEIARRRCEHAKPEQKAKAETLPLLDVCEVAA